jgi:signal transduction histidine kinase
MGERAAYLGGRVDVQSAPGTGTRVRAEIPLRDPALGEEE